MEKRLFLWIGIAIFGGMMIQTFIQLDKVSYQIEAALFIGIASVIYTILVVVKQKKFSLYLGAAGILALASVILIFIGPHLFGGH